MQNDTSRKGTRTKICFAPVTILKASSKMQLFSCSSQGPGPAGNDRESRAEDGCCSGASITSELLGLHPASPSTKPHPGTAPWTPLSQHSDTDRGQGDIPDSVRWRRLSPDTGCTLRRSKAGICQAAGSASRLLSLIGTGFSSVCSVTS